VASVTYKDYYALLGVDRGATAEEIKKAYRRKARELHPDRNKSKGAEERFREVNEAYEVLGDPQKRARYDQLGGNWRDGEAFQPPPGFEGFRVHVGDLGDLGEIFARGGGGGPAGFSNFFEMLFGDLGVGSVFGGAGRGAGRRAQRGEARGADIEAEVEFSLADLQQPTQRRISLAVPAGDGSMHPRTVTVNIPAGVRPGQRLRLAGQGGAGAPPGDILLHVRVRLEPNIQIRGDDVVTEVSVPAPVAVVGGEVRIPTPEGGVTLRIRPLTQPGTTLRVRERGLARKGGGRGDLLALVRIVVPEQPTAEEQHLYEQLAALVKPTQHK
jgi:curved DNA-binding protein